MNPAVLPSADVTPADPLGQAVADTQVRETLFTHAVALLTRYWYDRPGAARLEAAREAVQEVIGRALQKRQEFDSSRSVGAWLHGIMVNVVREMTRELRQDPVQATANVSLWEQVTKKLMPPREDGLPDGRSIDACLAELSEAHQKVLRLSYLEGLTHKEVASRLGVSVGNARTRLCRALAALKAVAGNTGKEAHQ